jgi:hypothetical protein
MKKPKSDIPPRVVERLVREPRRESAITHYRKMECLLDGKVVGERTYNQLGQLAIERPIKNGKTHGRMYFWNDDGTLNSVEPYLEGKPHGIARQYGRKGKVIGKYKLTHGTGFDIWRQETSKGRVSVSEIHSLRDGVPHGFEWWFLWKARQLSWERHWLKGRYHGIEREWDAKGKLCRGYPKYWIRGHSVTKGKYLKAAQTDNTLPVFREKDNSPSRKFPPKIERILSSH